MKIIFASIDAALTAQAKMYESAVGWEVYHGSIMNVHADAVVSPANSYGFMDGGIDLVYSQTFGWKVEAELQQLIIEKFDGELLVGQAAMVKLPPYNMFKFLISAPTMRVPMAIPVSNVYLATYAAIRCARAFGMQTVAIPGMGTGAGRVPPSDAVRAMIQGISDALNGRQFPKTLVQAAIDHRGLG